jgi:hypothetical protein
MICALSDWISNTRAFNSSVFAEIKLVCAVTTASALFLAASLALFRMSKSDEEHGGSESGKLVRIATMAVALAVLYSEELESIALVRSDMVDLRSLQSAGVG